MAAGAVLLVVMLRRSDLRQIEEPLGEVLDAAA
jgi:hypothetical protein